MGKSEQIQLRVEARQKRTIKHEADSLGLTVTGYLLSLHDMRVAQLRRADGSPADPLQEHVDACASRLIDLILMGDMTLDTAAEEVGLSRVEARRLVKALRDRLRRHGDRDE